MLDWRVISAPDDAPTPAPITVRAQDIAARSYFPEHEHDWGQLVYAMEGVLNVVVTGKSYIISPEQAVWLPPGTRHRVGSRFGAKFRSLWGLVENHPELESQTEVIGVGPLLKALITELVSLQNKGEVGGYRDRIVTLVFDQLHRSDALPAVLPWPTSSHLARLCEQLYSNPADARSAEQWCAELGMSSRTLSRRFETELGISFRAWKRRMRLFRAIEFLGGGMGVTQTALELGYGSSSAFSYAFRCELGTSPQSYVRSMSE